MSVERAIALLVLVLVLIVIIIVIFRVLDETAAGDIVYAASQRLTRPT